MSSSYSSFIDDSSISLCEILQYISAQTLQMILHFGQMMFLICLIPYGYLMRCTKRRKLTLNNATAVSTATQEDANAGAVSFLRYLYTYRVADFELDPALRYYEGLFLSLPLRIFASIVSSVTVLLNSITDFEGGVLVARTAFFDRLISNALKERINYTPDQRSNHRHSNHLSTCVDARDENCRDPIIVSNNRRRFQQLLILGAGYDTRAERFLELRRGVDDIDVWVIEVDQSIVQQNKIAKLKEQLGNKFKLLTEGIEFIECNFNYPGALRLALLDSKRFNPSLSTFVLWEGVTYYLPHSAIRETLDTLSQLRDSVNGGTAAEWKLVFDFLDEDALKSTAPLDQRIIIKAVAGINAPLKAGLPLDENALNQYMSSHGIKVQHVWKFLTIMSNMFPKLIKTSAKLSMAIAECSWISNTKSVLP